MRSKLGVFFLGALLCTPALGDEAPAPTILPMPELEPALVEVIPIREREVWFRNDWSVRMSTATYARP